MAALSEFSAAALALIDRSLVNEGGYEATKQRHGARRHGDRGVDPRVLLWSRRRPVGDRSAGGLRQPDKRAPQSGGFRRRQGDVRGARRNRQRARSRL